MLYLISFFFKKKRLYLIVYILRQKGIYCFDNHVAIEGILPTHLISNKPSDIEIESSYSQTSKLYIFHHDDLLSVHKLGTFIFVSMGRKNYCHYCKWNTHTIITNFLKKNLENKLKTGIRSEESMLNKQWQEERKGK